MTYTATDLFCGAGGLSAGLEMAGFTVLAGNDMFEAAGRTFEQTHPRARFIPGPIEDLSVERLMSVAWGRCDRRISSRQKGTGSPSDQPPKSSRGNTPRAINSHISPMPPPSSSSPADGSCDPGASVSSWSSCGTPGKSSSGAAALAASV